MAAQKGKSLLLKRGDGASPETFSTVGGLRTTRVAFNKETVDITNKDSANNWRELLAGAGVRSASFSGAGVFTDSAAEQSIQSDFFGSTFNNMQVIVPDLGTFEGSFEITQLEYDGEHNGEATYSVTLESAAAVTFTAA